MKNLLSLLFAVLFSLPAMAQVSFGKPSLFNDGWLFSMGDDEKMSSAAFEDGKWRKLELPHDWSIEGLMSPTLASCTGYLPAGVAWYRKHFDVDDLTNRHYIHRLLRP